MASRIEVVTPCDRCGRWHAKESFVTSECFGDGGSRRVLDPGSYVLIEKVNGEWPEWLVREAPYVIGYLTDDHDALAGGEQP